VAARLTATRRMMASHDGLQKRSPEQAAFLRGLVFVDLYATYEFTLRSSVQAALSFLRKQQRTIGDVRPELLALILEPSWEATRTAGRSKLWAKRLDLLAETSSGRALAAVDDTLFPSDGSHYRPRQLVTVWAVLGIAQPTVPENRLLGRIEELVENRNAVSHGRRTAGEVGRGYSRSDIDTRIDDVEHLCEYVLSTIESHCQSGALMRA
jgi:hypothetical protein